MSEVIMPKMGDAMEEGTLVRWIKGDEVTLELESEHAGTLSELVAGEGQEVPSGRR